MFAEPKPINHNTIAVNPMSIAYLISYGSAGQLGRFVARDSRQTFRRGDRVIIQSERGRELGTVLASAQDLAFPATLQHIPGEIVDWARPEDESAARALSEKLAAAFKQARAIVEEQGAPVELVDLEAVADPLTYIVHIVRYHDEPLQPIRDTLAIRLAAQVLFHDVTNPVALETQDESGCGSCGSEGGGCSSKGGCSNGSCGSGCGSSKEFPHQWQAYFAELRQHMEKRKQEILLVE
jgi:hypothetical protein